MKILIVDDHMIVRQGLMQILVDEFETAVFGEAGNANDALQRVHEDTWGMVLLDLSLPGRSGLDIIGELRTIQPDLRVLVLSMHPETEYAVRALKAGASGYLTKQSAGEELVEAIRHIFDGGRYISRSLAEQLAANLTDGAGGLPHEKLSDREFQTLRLLAKGHSVKEIGATLGLSAKTVSTYRARILEKLELNSTVDIARYALAHGLG